MRSFSHLSTQWQRLAAWHYPQKSEHNYWVSSTVPAETLWQTVTNLADLAAWHPLITQTNAPRGQQAKPGLIYRAFNCYVPLSTKIFVERVLPGELLSVRLFPLPGLQERATYRIVSTICGTCVFYSVTLSGWLSPLVWPVVRPQVEQVATALIQAAEQSTQQLPKQSGTSRRRAYSLNNQDIFS
ncbi:MAG: SRPBCC family protein [Cyanobacteria bacterium J06649_4]